MAKLVVFNISFLQFFKKIITAERRFSASACFRLIISWLSSTCLKKVFFVKNVPIIEILKTLPAGLPICGTWGICANYKAIFLRFNF